MRMPASRAISSMRSWRAAPSGPLSRKPPLGTTAKATRLRAHSSMTPSTPAAGTPMKAMSMSPSIAEIDG
jgi:hypothetical protein